MTGRGGSGAKDRPADLESIIGEIEVAIQFCEAHNLTGAAVDLSMGIDKLRAAKVANERR